MPWLDDLMRKNPIARYITKKSSTSANFGADKINDRRSNGDFLSKLLRAAKTNPDVVDDQAIVSYMVTNLTAGSDTTAISIRAVIYCLLKNPAAYQRLREDIGNSGLPDGPVSWAKLSEVIVPECLRQGGISHAPSRGSNFETPCTIGA